LNDISDLVNQLKQRGAHTVALQFPAGLKRRAAEYATRLRTAGFVVIISGDPCYGACDLALDTLSYADVLVHIGHTPVDTREHVIFEPYPVDFDVSVLANALPFLKEKTVGLVTTVQHIHCIPAMEAFLRENGIDVRVLQQPGLLTLPKYSSSAQESFIRLALPFQREHW
jgi:2-(3-amino-3-carboxypropyl)histidine synthase